MTVCYLDADDEITDAVARLRTTSDQHFILVLPAGSRVATSRINFRLLAREGQERKVMVGMVSGESGVRSLAISAGMPAYATVEEAEAALAQRAEGQAEEQAGQAASVDSPPDGDARPPVANVGPPGVSARDSSLEATRILPRSDPWHRQVAEARPRRRSKGVMGWLVRLAALAALAGGGLYAAYLYLPNVSISLTPMTLTAGPVTVEVTADPAVAVADPEAAIVPAERVDVPLSATDQFPATGSEISQTRASGTVRFTSENTLFEVPIPEGTRLTTSSGTTFETTQGLTIPQASFQSGPSTAEANIRAIDPGPAGNVEAATITGLPEPITAQLVRVTNPQPTSGGRREETRVVTRADYDAAVVALEAIMDEQLAAALADPEMTPRGLRLFPETAIRERLTTDLAAGDLVDQRQDDFSLSAESRGTVLAVDESAVAEVGTDRLEDALPPGSQLFPDSVRSTVGEPRLVGDAILYEVEAVGEHFQPVDRAAVVAAIRGRTVSEARAILDDYGSVSITPWPDFIDAVPDDARRINLTVLEPQQRSP
ncbi:MAG: baseplate J/gp47 family protein [Chloroflexota bacterium]|nr:baseplate J/gp47 family protein [Chloroflexota bacterium]